MRNILLNKWILLVVVIIISGVSLLVSFYENDYSWFGRSGSIVTIIGLLLTIKHTVLSESRDIETVVIERNNYSRFAPDLDSTEWKEKVKQAEVSLREEYLGLFLTIIGTVIWGYGDLLG